MSKALLLKVTHRQHAMLLAALRNWQLDAMNEGYGLMFKDFNGGNWPEPTDADIDLLCDQINFDAEEIDAPEYDDEEEKA